MNCSLEITVYRERGNILTPSNPMCKFIEFVVHVHDEDEKKPLLSRSDNSVPKICLTRTYCLTA